MISKSSFSFDKAKLQLIEKIFRDSNHIG